MCLLFLLDGVGTCSNEALHQFFNQMIHTSSTSIDILEVGPGGDRTVFATLSMLCVLRRLFSDLFA
jgi:hypothetical protein